MKYGEYRMDVTVYSSMGRKKDKFSTWREDFIQEAIKAAQLPFEDGDVIIVKIFPSVTEG